MFLYHGFFLKKFYFNRFNTNTSVTLTMDHKPTYVRETHNLIILLFLCTRARFNGLLSCSESVQLIDSVKRVVLKKSRIVRFCGDVCVCAVIKNDETSRLPIRTQSMNKAPVCRLCYRRQIPKDNANMDGWIIKSGS